MRLSRFAAVGFAAALAILTLAATGARAGPVWPQSLGDIPADPTVTFGVLPNGMRYAIEHNATPPGQVSVRFVILAGSMQEGPDQHGLAHFLEHMAFHGSTHVADGDERATLERMGLRFGPDVNAATGPQATMYKFDLPAGDSAHVDAALMFTREIASELTLDAKLMDAERGVILNEARAREGAVQDLRQALIADRIGDHPFARLTVGTSNDIKTGTVAALRTFYDAYYRPERAVLVVVGDVDPAAVEAKIKARFSDWTGRGTPGADPAPVSAAPAEAPSIKIDSAAGAPGSGLVLMWNHPYQGPDLTRADLSRHIALNLAERAVVGRAGKENDAAGNPLMAANGPSTETIAGVARTTEWRTVTVNRLGPAVNLLMTEERQLAQFGLTQAELDLQVARSRAEQDDYVRTGATRSTLALADGLVGSATSGEVYLSPEQQLAALDATVHDLTLARANELLRDELTASAPRLVYYGPPLPADGEAVLRRALAEAHGAPVVAYVDPGAAVWRHTDFGPPGKVAERRVMPETGATFVRFANGVTLVVKHTDFAKDQVLVTADLGFGQLALPRDRVAASDLGVSLFLLGGLTDLTLRQMGETLIGHHVPALLAMQPDHFQINNLSAGPPTPSEDLGLQLQVITAELTAPGWRVNDWNAFLTNADDADRAARSNPAAFYIRNVVPDLHVDPARRADDMRWEPSTAEMRRTWTPEQAEAFIRPIIETSPLQVTVVGDVTVDAAIGAVASTLGALPPRPQQAEPAKLRDVRFPAPRKDPLVFKYGGPADQALTVVDWPTTDAFANTRQTQAARVLADVMTARLFDELRVKHGWTYSPSVGADFSTFLPGYGTITARVTSRPQDIPAILDAIDAIAADIAQNGVSADAFARAVEPRIDATKRAYSSNVEWLVALAGGQRDPRFLHLQLSTLADLQSLTPDDVRAAARRWLMKDRSLRIEIVPAVATLAGIP
jgi:zinc protease